MEIRKRRSVFSTAVVAALSAMCATSEPLKLAVIAGEGDHAPKVGVTDLLTVELSRQDGVVVLEREDVRRVLAEQSLSAAGLDDRVRCMRVGAMLHADALLVVDCAGKDEAAPCRARFIESRTGIVIGERFFDAVAVRHNPTEFLVDLGRMLTPVLARDAPRRYVAVIDFAAEDRGRRLDGFPVALAALVEQQLAFSTNVVIVDRENLQHLVKEKDLTGADIHLAVSAYLVEGQVRAAAGGPIDVDTVIQPLGTKASPATFHIQTKAGEALDAARSIANQILLKVGASPLPASTTPASQEAKWLVKHAETLQRYGELAQSVRCLESAYALDAAPATARLLSDAVHDLAMQRAAACTGELPEEEKRRLIEIFTRAMQLWQVEMKAITATADQESGFGPVRGIPPPNLLGILWQRLRSADPETRDLYQELRQQKMTCRRMEEAYIRKIRPHSFHHELTYMIHEAIEIDNLCTNGADYAEQTRDLLRAFLEAPGKPDRIILWAMAERPRWQGFPSCTLDAAGVRARVDLANWLGSYPDIACRMAGLYYQVLVYKKLDPPKTAAPAEALLRLYPDFLREYGHDLHAWAILYNTACVDASGVDVKAMQAAILDANVKCLDPSSFLEWFSSGSLCQGAGALSPDAQRQWLHAAASNLPPVHVDTYRPATLQLAVETAYQVIAQRLGELGESPLLIPDISPYWQAYRVEPVPCGTGPQPGEQLAVCKRDGDAIALVWTKADDKAGDQRIRVEVMGTDGRLKSTFPIYHWPTNDSQKALQPCDLALLPGKVFVAAGNAGLLVFGSGGVRQMGTDTGFPRAALTAVAVLGQKLYLGFNDYLCVLDPDSERLDDIAYSRSLLKRNPLDGCQQRFTVCSLAADPAQACLWIVTQQPTGEWRLDLPTRRIEPAGQLVMTSVALDEGQVLGAIQDFVWRHAAGQNWNRIPMYGATVLCAEGLHVLLGNDVISAGRVVSGGVTTGRGCVGFVGKGGLYLHKRCTGQSYHLPLGTNQQPTHVDFLVKTSPRTALAVTHAGACWKLTQPETPLPDEIAFEQNARDLQNFIAAHTNRIPVASVTASSVADAGGEWTFAPTNVCDGKAGTCWAAATNEARGAWLEFTFEKPACVAGLRVINGWVPDTAWLDAAYPDNHRARTLSVTTDRGEVLRCDLDDRHDPQYVRLPFQQPAQRLRATITAIYATERIHLPEPSRLTLSELTFLGEPVP